MKNFKIFSPAYKANGYLGTYFSIAICDDNGNFVKVIGDHCDSRVSGNCFNGYTNINEIKGLPFSDADRFIEFKQVEVDTDALTIWESGYIESTRLTAEWYESRKQLTGTWDVYSFLYDKKGRKIQENADKFDEWVKANPYPAQVDYYEFLKCICHEN